MPLMKLTPERLTAFCAALSETCNVGKACAAIDISRWTAYKWRRDMPDFADAWDEAMRAGVTALEDEAHRRAFEGVEDPLVHLGQFTYLYREARDERGQPILDENGKPVMVPWLDAKGEHKQAAVRKYSDTLAIFLLKAHAPTKYRDNASLQISGQLSLGEMSEDEMRAELAALTASGVVLPGTDDDGSDLV